MLSTIHLDPSFVWVFVALGFSSAATWMVHHTYTHTRQRQPTPASSHALSNMEVSCNATNTSSATNKCTCPSRQKPARTTSNSRLSLSHEKAAQRTLPLALGQGKTPQVRASSTSFFAEESAHPRSATRSKKTKPISRRRSNKGREEIMTKRGGSLESQSRCKRRISDKLGIRPVMAVRRVSPFS